MCVPTIKFNFNQQKAIETILFFANAREDKLSVMHMLKFIYYADKYHLNKYDRPIIGDRYCAMQNGPVASNVYNLLKKSCEDFVINSSGKKYNNIEPLRKPDLDYFSDTDIEAMEWVLEEFKNYNAEQMSLETHKTKAWKNAWEHRGLFKKSIKMDYVDFFDTEDDERIEHLKEYGELIVI